MGDETRIRDEEPVEWAASRALYDGLYDNSIAFADPDDVLGLVDLATRDVRPYESMLDRDAERLRLTDAFFEARYATMIDLAVEDEQARASARENEFLNSAASASGVTSEAMAKALGEADAGQPDALRKVFENYFYC